MKKRNKDKIEEYKRELIEIFSKVSHDKSLTKEFFVDILTPSEFEAIALRWQIVKRISKGETHRSKIKNNFSSINGVCFKETDIKKIQMIERGEKLHVISTVCPDYSNDGQKYTFSGPLGSSVSLTAQEHLTNVPALLEVFNQIGFVTEWKILIADLPEVIDSQRDFILRVSQGKEDYLSRCARSAIAIQEKVSNRAQVQTFSDFYGNVGLDYLNIQETVAKKIREEGEKPPFRSRFITFSMARAELACRFRGGKLSLEEVLNAGAHGMSLYITHGTLLRNIFLGQRLLLVNHQTPNLQNFYLAKFVPGFEDLENTPKFPLGILEKKLY